MFKCGKWGLFKTVESRAPYPVRNRGYGEGRGCGAAWGILRGLGLVADDMPTSDATRN